MSRWSKFKNYIWEFWEFCFFGSPFDRLPKEKKGAWNIVEPPDGEKKVVTFDGKIIEHDKGYDKPHFRTERLASSAEDVVLAASRRGQSHEHDGRFRDDDFAVDFDIKTDCFVLAVADGAGSARYSRKGAQLACDTAVENVLGFLNQNPEFFDEEFLCNADSIRCRNGLPPTADDTVEFCGRYLYKMLVNSAFAARNSIKQEAVRIKGLDPNAIRDTDFKEYSTTLHLVVAKRLASTDWFFGSFCIGDGAVAIYSGDTKCVQPFVLPLHGNDHGEFSGETVFLTTKRVWETKDDPMKIMNRLRAVVVSDPTALFLTTDGVSDAFFKNDAELEDTKKWGELTEAVNEAVRSDVAAEQRLLDWLRFESKGNFDDRTMIVLLPHKSNR